MALHTQFIDHQSRTPHEWSRWPATASMVWVSTADDHRSRYRARNLVARRDPILVRDPSVCPGQVQRHPRPASPDAPRSNADGSSKALAGARRGQAVHLQRLVRVQVQLDPLPLTDDGSATGA